MKQSTVLVGGGVIARHYKRGLEKSNTLQLTALVDVNPDCVARDCYSVPFFTDVSDALALNPRIALLALSLAARDEVARKLMRQGVAVLTEKPMLGSLQEVEALLAYANECRTPLACLFHWKAANEVRYLKNNLPRLGKITEISATVHDDYAATPNGAIRPDRVGLMGAWIDSGINILSYYDEIIDLSEAVLREEIILPDRESGLPKYAKKVFDASGVRAEIIVDWRTQSRQKTSRITCGLGTLFVDHTAQTVELNGETVFASPVEDRLSSHYENLFFDLSFQSLAQSQKSTLLLHKLLFTGNAR